MPRLVSVFDFDAFALAEACNCPIPVCKGGNSKSEMNQANQLSQQQLNLQNQQLQMQNQMMGTVNPQLNAIIQNGGMLPAQQAAMTSQALNGLGSQYQNLYGQLSQTLAARGITGGQNAGAGALAQSFGSLGAQEAGQQSQLLNQIQLAKGQNLMGALGMGMGEGQMYGNQALGFGNQGVSSLGIGQQAANAADQATTGFWGSLVGGLAGMGGNFLTGGASSLINKCWVAAELYGGWFVPETVAIRRWLTQTWYMAPFTLLYKVIGRDWAKLIRKNHTLRCATKRLFDLFLRIANG